jgi:hypothetical protein
VFAAEGVSVAIADIQSDAVEKVAAQRPTSPAPQ